MSFDYFFGPYWTIFDFVMIVIMGLSTWLGWRGGFIKEALGFCLWAGVIWLGMTKNQYLEPHVVAYLPVAWSRAISSLLMMCLSLMLLHPLSHVIRSGLKSFGVQMIDQPLGAAFGVARGGFLVLVACYVIGYSSYSKEKWFKRSHTYDKFNSFRGYFKENSYFPLV